MSTCVSVWVGGGIQRVTYEFRVYGTGGGGYVGIEEISGIGSLCSCPEQRHNASDTCRMCSKNTKKWSRGKRLTSSRFKYVSC